MLNKSLPVFNPGGRTFPFSRYIEDTTEWVCLIVVKPALGDQNSIMCCQRIFVAPNYPKIYRRTQDTGCAQSRPISKPNKWNNFPIFIICKECFFFLVSHFLTRIHQGKSGPGYTKTLNHGKNKPPEISWSGIGCSCIGIIWFDPGLSGPQ